VLGYVMIAIGPCWVRYYSRRQSSPCNRLNQCYKTYNVDRPDQGQWLGKLLQVDE